MKLLIISGLSGSGKSTALRTLEDLDFYCIDNLPLSMLPNLATQMRTSTDTVLENTAVGIDARTMLNASDDIHDILENIRLHGIDCRIIYFKADDNHLLKRYSETRRRHPLSSDSCSLAEAIRQERKMLESIFAMASQHVDTSHMTPQDLRDFVTEHITDSAHGMSVLFESFGFKYGVPTEADFIFDVRCLPNPHWEPALRPLTGADKAVEDFLEQQSETRKLLDEIGHFLGNWLPKFEQANRNYMTIAIGCTGGQHRSVYMVRQLAELFQQQRENVLIRHRELT
ncbi:RNase adapter RapZ [Sulfuriflexus mobilis]|uniref:RNase adapter RapZ n=1 Tax=Sulfuriflexus mobilis TaxID=1811807 RepID=UPI000F824C5F|nr:RNase adapter RapZ [Sulfuriflexus mobilis]